MYIHIPVNADVEATFVGVTDNATEELQVLFVKSSSNHSTTEICLNTVKLTF